MMCKNCLWMLGLKDGWTGKGWRIFMEARSDRLRFWSWTVTEPPLQLDDASPPAWWCSMWKTKHCKIVLTSSFLKTLFGHGHAYGHSLDVSRSVSNHSGKRQTRILHVQTEFCRIAFQPPPPSSKRTLCGRYFSPKISKFFKTAILTLGKDILKITLVKHDSLMVFWCKSW